MSADVFRGWPRGLDRVGRGQLARCRRTLAEGWSRLSRPGWSTPQSLPSASSIPDIVGWPSHSPMCSVGDLAESILLNSKSNCSSVSYALKSACISPISAPKIVNFIHFLFLNVLEAGIDWHVTYRATVLGYSQLYFVDLQTWTMWAEPGVAAFIIFLAQLFFLNWCWRVTNKSWIVLAFLVPFWLAATMVIDLSIPTVQISALRRSSINQSEVVRISNLKAIRRLANALDLSFPIVWSGLVFLSISCTSTIAVLMMLLDQDTDIDQQTDFTLNGEHNMNTITVVTLVECNITETSISGSEADAAASQMNSIV
ncbi:hypothetical protein C8R44DRAFT_731915 [Mycena epipterygia]|nr:hypothetical protein C8R44DRAFT_731915 [Mycena epipterygia]